MMTRTRELVCSIHKIRMIQCRTHLKQGEGGSNETHLLAVILGLLNVPFVYMQQKYQREKNLWKEGLFWLMFSEGSVCDSWGHALGSNMVAGG